MKKKLLSLLLAVAMIITLVPGAFAASGYSDVADDEWFAEPVAYATEHGLMSGVGNGRFAPNDPMTRAMAVQVLYRIAGSPHTHSDNPFEDVPADEWYTTAVLWAVENGITGGTSATTFSPDELVTREQLVTFLYKYAKTTGMEMSSADLSNFSDAGQISCWAVDAFQWAVSAGVISGVGHNRIAPLANATRAECATILAKFDQMVHPEKPVDPETCDHEWVEKSIMKKPTCIDPGWRSMVCAKCGVESDEWEYIPPLGHDWDEGTVTKAPTATEEGITTYTCKRCGRTREESIPVLSDCEHVWGEPVRTDPTCTENGSIVYTCTKCGAQRREILKAKGHDFRPYEKNDHATCTEPEFITYMCRYCGETETQILREALGHDWDDGVTTKEPTGSEDGIMTYTCNRCGETREEVIPATGESDHDWVFHNAYWECNLCGEKVCASANHKPDDHGCRKP